MELEHGTDLELVVQRIRRVTVSEEDRVVFLPSISDREDGEPEIGLAQSDLEFDSTQVIRSQIITQKRSLIDLNNEEMFRGAE